MFSTPFFVGKLDYEYEIPEDIDSMTSRVDKNLESSEKYYDYHNVHLLHEDLPELNSEIMKCCEKLVEDVQIALGKRLSKTVIGDPTI